MSPPSARLVCKVHPNKAARALYKAHEKEVKEHVAGHVANVDHKLVVDKGRCCKGYRHIDCAGSQIPGAEQGTKFEEVMKHSLGQ